MNFKINVYLTDKDYMDYNVFWMTKSAYGKKQMVGYRIFIAVFIAALCALSLAYREDGVSAFVPIVAYLAVLVLFQIFLVPILVGGVKGTFNLLKKQGKMGYSPNSEMEFFEDCFVEITPEAKTEQKYLAIERISVIGEKVVYVHVNNVAAYILPNSCFASTEQYDEFMRFIRTKCQNVDVY